MITLGGIATKVHLAIEPIDLRRGYGGLYTMVEQKFGGEPQEGHLWVFSNKRRDMLKICKQHTEHSLGSWKSSR